MMQEVTTADSSRAVEPITATLYWDTRVCSVCDGESSRHHVLSGAVFDGKGFCMRTATMKFCVRGMTIGSNTVVAQLPGSKGSAEVGGNCVSPTNRSPVNAHD